MAKPPDLKVESDWYIVHTKVYAESSVLNHLVVTLEFLYDWFIVGRLKSSDKYLMHIQANNKLNNN